MVSIKSFENALPYLSCIDGNCNGDLELKGDSLFEDNKAIKSGYLVCSCGRDYKISEGIPYFFNFIEKQNNREIDEIKADIIRFVEESDAKLCLDGFKELGYALLSKYGRSIEGRRRAMMDIFTFEREITKCLFGEKNAMVSQATTAARYDLENYRGSYVLPEKVTDKIKELVPENSMIFEGATGPGDNLKELAGRMKSKVAIGIDISENMVREAQERVRESESIFVAQGSLECIPLKRRTVDLININNVIDRVPDPRKIAGEFRRISKDGCVMAVFNCYPIQFTSPDGSKVYVPEGKRLDTAGMVRASGFSPFEYY